MSALDNLPSLSTEEFERAYPDEKPTETPKRPKFQSFTLGEIAKMKLPNPGYILWPWLREAETAVISAKCGIGKTQLCLSIAAAITSGCEMFGGRWSAPFSRRLLYVDGEMTVQSMISRAEKFGINSGNDKFFLFNGDLVPDFTGINLWRGECQNALVAEIERVGADVVILDNLASLYRPPQTNQAESWHAMMDFILLLRRRGVALIIVDHEGKTVGNSPRGTSAKGDIAHVMISLQRPENYEQSEGCRFTLSFTKTRSFYGENADPFECHLKNGEWEASDVSSATTRGRPKSHKETEALRLLDAGTSVQDVADKLGTSLGTIYRWRQNSRKTIPQQPFDDFSDFTETTP
ncbi:MAG: AAA family ATPase [Planctomycetia bacterium]|nr:AAA family ATPase [Planctomycetia bacterium]